jgi:hypothetical protein
VSFVNENPKQGSGSGSGPSEDEATEPNYGRSLTETRPFNAVEKQRSENATQLVAEASPSLSRSSLVGFRTNISDVRRETSLTDGHCGFIEADDLNASPTSLPSSVLSRLSTPRRASLYMDALDGNLVDPQRAKLLHYFKIWVGQPWVSVI